MTKLFFSGNFAEYTITTSQNQVTVEDSNTDRDGKDALVNVEILKFADQEITL